MWSAPYEGLVGWRYLLRRRLSPRVLIIGLVILGAGLGMTSSAFDALSGGQGLTQGIYQDNPLLLQVMLYGGLGLLIFGGCVVLFGLLSAWLTIFSAFSAFMITIGVALVIVVLGVMNGFQADLRNKIINTHAHVVIEPPKGVDGFGDYREIARLARETEGVIGASPYLSTEVMLSSRTNLSAVLLQGIDPDTVGETSQLPQNIERGDLETLKDPSLLKPMDLEDVPPAGNLSEGEDRIAAHLAAEAQRDAEAAAEGEEAEAAEADSFGMALPAPKKQDPSLLPVVFIGKELRRSLNLWPGESVNVISPFGDLGPNGPIPRSRPFRLGGWYKFGMLDYDTKLAYASLPAVQAFMGLGDVAGGIQVKVSDLEGARAVRDSLQAALGDRARVSDWQDRNRNLFSALKLEKVAMFLVLSINILLAAFSIIGTLVITIFERKREIAILNACGAPSSGIRRIFMAQGAFTGAVGCLLGGTVGVSLGYALATMRLPMDTNVYYIDAIPVDLRLTDVVAIIAVAMLVSVVSTLYPAHYASRLKPVEGLSND
ncbi:MAG: FtsX-like permease family protein [Bradymonadia bacterium]